MSAGTASSSPENSFLAKSHSVDVNVTAPSNLQSNQLCFQGGFRPAVLYLLMVEVVVWSWYCGGGNVMVVMWTQRTSCSSAAMPSFEKSWQCISVSSGRWSRAMQTFCGAAHAHCFRSALTGQGCRGPVLKRRPLSAVRALLPLLHLSVSSHLHATGGHVTLCRHTMPASCSLSCLSGYRKRASQVLPRTETTIAVLCRKPLPEESEQMCCKRFSLRDLYSEPNFGI